MKKYLIALLAVCLLLAMALPAYALEYSFEEAESPNYGKPSSVEPVVTADGGAEKNEDISKNAARIPPGFGSAMSNTLHTGEYLTPNLVPSAMAATGEMVSGGAAVVFPPDMSGLSAEAPATRRLQTISAIGMGPWEPWRSRSSACRSISSRGQTPPP